MRWPATIARTLKHYRPAAGDLASAGNQAQESALGGVRIAGKSTAAASDHVRSG
jgi:hypothetical protein